jgi:hypothetical protein
MSCTNAWDGVTFMYDRTGRQLNVRSSGVIEAQNPHELGPTVLQILRQPNPERRSIAELNHAAGSREARALTREFLGTNFINKRLDLDLTLRRLANTVFAKECTPIPQILHVL